MLLKNELLNTNTNNTNNIYKQHDQEKHDTLFEMNCFIREELTTAQTMSIASREELKREVEFLKSKIFHLMKLNERLLNENNDLRLQLNISLI